MSIRATPIARLVIESGLSATFTAGQRSSVSYCRHIYQLRLNIKALKWIMARMAPRKYGNR
jgi:Bacteriophage Sf6, terminase small subunit-like